MTAFRARLRIASVGVVGGRDVRGALIRAPWWALACLQGGFFGLLMFGVGLVAFRSTSTSLTFALVAGVKFGLILGPVTARANRRFVAAQGAIPREREREARRAVMRGPAPSDPAVREAALRLVNHQLHVMRRQRWHLLLFGVGATYVASALLNPSWLTILGALFFALAAVLQLTLSRRLRKRRRVLTGDAPPA